MRLPVISSAVACRGYIQRIRCDIRRCFGLLSGFRKLIVSSVGTAQRQSRNTDGFSIADFRVLKGSCRRYRQFVARYDTAKNHVVIIQRCVRAAVIRLIRCRDSRNGYGLLADDNHRGTCHCVRADLRRLIIDRIASSIRVDGIFRAISSVFALAVGYGYAVRRGYTNAVRFAVISPVVVCGGHVERICRDVCRCFGLLTAFRKPVISGVRAA